MSNPYEPPVSDLWRADGMGRDDRPATAPGAKLAWYDQAWLALPFGLMIIGGAIGGACGGVAWAANQKVFRATRQPVLRYVWTGLISVAAVGAYLAAVLAFVAFLGGRG